MDSGKRIPPIKFRPAASELQTITRKYQGLSWQLKGTLGALKGMKYRLPQFNTVLVAPTNTSPPEHLRARLATTMQNAIDALERCETLIKELSAAHRAAYKYTRELTQENTHSDM